MQRIKAAIGASVCLGSLVLGVGLARGEALQLASPNREIVLRLDSDSEGHLIYAITQDRRIKIDNSKAGIIIDQTDLGAGVEIGRAESQEIHEVFPRLGVKSQATNHCIAYQVPMRVKSSGLAWTLEVRLFNDGVGFRYRVPGSGPRRIEGESTAWQLPPDTTVWYQTDTVNYEGDYRSHPPEEVPVESQSQKGKRPVFIGCPMTIVYPGGGYGLLSEAALYQYSGMSLQPTGTRLFKAAFDDDPKGWDHTGPVVSPWRVILLASNLNGLVNSDLILALCPPPDPQLFPQGLKTPWIKPGKAPITWAVFGNDGAQWHRQKWFVDQCAAMNCEYLLVDAGWRTEKWGWLKDGGDLWQRCAELCRYAAERNVGIVLWHAFPEGRDDGPGLTTLEAREELFQKAHQAGVKGVKIDFFDSESKRVIEAYEDLMRRAAQYQLMINFHGANKPTGEERTWPHVVTREGIREQEYVLWDKLPLPHYGALPFTRMVAGYGDFLPGYVRPKFLKNTTAVFQMATVVIYTSPFVCWPDHPEAYLDSSFLPYVRSVPTVWDETKVLEASAIGETVVFARRSGTDWHLAALNCRNEPKALQIPLSFLEKGDYDSVLYREAQGSANSFQVEEGALVRKDQTIQCELKPGGGFLARFHKPRTYPGWQ